MADIECGWGPRHYRFTQTHSTEAPVLGQQGHTGGGAEGIELSGVRTRASFSQSEMLSETIIYFLSPPPTELAGGHHI